MIKVVPFIPKPKVASDPIKDKLKGLGITEESEVNDIKDFLGNLKKS